MGSRYAAFLSYSHSADQRLAATVQRALQRLGKPWYRRPTLKIFRDETSLSANPGLWTSIERNLEQSDYFLLFASPGAAGSPWVAKEVQWWREHRDADSLLIVVTDGKIAWDARSLDFDWEQTTCLPSALRGFAREEPLYVDLRWARRRQLLRFRDPRFREAMLMLLAAVTGRAKDEIDSEDIRQQRRLRLTAAATVLLIIASAVGAVYGAWIAETNRREAENNHRQSESRRLAAAALAAWDQNDGMDRAITLGVLAWRVARTPEAKSALQKLQSNTSDVTRILGRHTAEIRDLAFSGDGSVLATAAEDGSIILWRAPDWRRAGAAFPSEHSGLRYMALDWTGSHIVVQVDVRNFEKDRHEDRTLLWDVKSGTSQTLLGDPEGHISFGHPAPSPDGEVVAIRSLDGELAIWNPSARTVRSPIGKTEVIGYRFVDSTDLVFLSWDWRHNQKGDWQRYRQAGHFNLTTSQIKLGPSVAVDDEHELMEPWTLSGDGLKAYCPLCKTRFWAVQPDLTLAPVKPPDRMPGRVHYVVFDHRGERVLIAGDSVVSPSFRRLLVWDRSRNQMRKLLDVELGYGGFNAMLSPDGRWLAAIVGSRDAPVVVWDLDRSGTADPAQTLDAVCNLEQSDCIRRLCEKISKAVDEPQLRELVGDDAVDEFNSTIGAARCEQ